MSEPMNTENTTLKTPLRRRSGSREQIDRLLAERQQMLRLMCEVSGMEPFARDKPVDQELQDFCQILVDYIAAGHFGLYQRIIAGKERRRELIALAADIYPEIEESTRIALAFNERYQDAGQKVDDPEVLSRDLSRLGEVLAARIDLEDELIAAMGLRPARQ